MDRHHPFEADLFPGTDWLIRLRWIAVAAILLIVALASRVPGTGDLAVGRQVIVGLTIGAYNLALVLHVRGLKRARQAAALPAGRFQPVLERVVAAQIGLDVTALALLLHLAGGVENPAALFFVFHVITAGILLSPGLSYLTAALAAVLYAAMAALEYAAVLPHYHLPLLGTDLSHERLYVLAATATLILTLFLVAYFTTSIIRRLRQRESQLQTSMDELENANTRLQQVDIERTRFMTLVTHELRSPLSIIYSAIDLVLEGYASGEQTQQVLERAQNRASEMLEMVDDLLNLTRAREGAPRPDGPAAVHPAGPLREAVDAIRVEAERKEIELVVDIAPDLPLAAATGDELRLVWNNLLNNAVKYTPPGGRVSVALGQTGDHIVGIVRDTGIGILPDDVPRLFDEFFRGQNARKMSAHGTGVGLAIVRRVLENRGGTIQVASEPEQGSTFTFTLPRRGEAL